MEVMRAMGRMRKMSILEQHAGHSGNRVGDVEAVDVCALTSMGKGGLCSLGKDRIGDEGIHRYCPRLAQHHAAFVQGTACLHQVIHNDDMATLVAAVFNAGDAPLPVPTGLATSDHLEAFAGEHASKALGSAVVMEGDIVHRTCRMFRRLLTKSLSEQRDCGLQAPKRVLVKEKRFCKVCRSYISSRVGRPHEGRLLNISA